MKGLKAPFKRRRVVEKIQKQDIYIACKRHISDLKTHRRLKARIWERVFHGNGNEKKAGIVMLISDKIDLKWRL